MKTLLVAFGILACVMVVGYVEDPCSTEGLPAGCMEQN
jgi:hypothetical protein